MYIKEIEIQGKCIVQCEIMYIAIYIILLKETKTTINFKYVIESNRLAYFINRNHLANGCKLTSSFYS